MDFFIVLVQMAWFSGLNYVGGGCAAVPRFGLGATTFFENIESSIDQR